MTSEIPFSNVWRTGYYLTDYHRLGQPTTRNVRVAAALAWVGGMRSYKIESSREGALTPVEKARDDESGVAASFTSFGSC